MNKADGTHHTLETVREEKDLGVVIDSQLTFSKHISLKVNKANSIMGLIRRTFRHLDEQTFRGLFKALVRPHLEYAGTVWNPATKKDITALENVQRRATKLMPSLKQLSYEERLRRIDLPTLRYRRLRGDMIETYKMLTGLYDPDTQPLLELDNNQRTRGHPYKLLKPRCRTSHRLNTFTHRIVNPWNSLPDSVVDATSIAAFERRLDKHWANLDMKYVYDSNSPVVVKSDQSADFDIPNTDLDIQDH